MWCLLTGSVLIKLFLLFLLLLFPCLLNLPLLILLQKVNTSAFLLISSILFPTFLRHGALHSSRELFLSIVWLISGIVLFVEYPKQNVWISMFQLFGSILIFKVIQYSKILSSKVETVELLRKSNQHLGPGLAKSFFR